MWLIDSQDYNNEVIENSATVEAVREEGGSARVDGGNMNIEQTIDGIQEEVRDENEKVSIIYSYDISVSILVKGDFFPFV